MKRAAVVLASLGLAACGQNDQEAARNAAVAPANSPVAVANAEAEESSAAGSTSAPPPRAEANASGPASGFGSLPPANAPLRFLGSWAASQAECASRPWRFTRTELTTANGSHCSIYKVSQVPGGYDLAAECPAKKPVPTDLIKLRFAESARAMLVESNAIAPKGLVYCGK
jgi:hypothetical protein